MTKLWTAAAILVAGAGLAIVSIGAGTATAQPSEGDTPPEGRDMQAMTQTCQRHMDEMSAMMEGMDTRGMDSMMDGPGMNGMGQ